MIKIGMVGEAPNDTNAIRNLLSKKYSYGEYEYIPLLDRINGSQLDSQKTKRLLRIEYEDKKPDLIIFIRDLDSVETRSEAFRHKKIYFSEFNRVVDKKGIFLLHIFEIEAIILSNIDVFNSVYKVNIEFVENCMKVHDPKGFLRSKCNDYNESDNAMIFEQISFDTVYANCNYFTGFINRFEKIINR